MRQLKQIYKDVYAFLCGRHPYLRLWHFQWLAGKNLYRHLREWLPRLQGRVLDVGCGEKPYQSWMVNISDYVGIDVPDNPNADIHILPDATWELPDASFDGVVCTQVIEHVADLSLTLSEIHRVLKPGGLLILSAPFIYSLHFVPHDYRRFSTYELHQLLTPQYEIKVMLLEGGVGSTLGTLLLNWLDHYPLLHPVTRVLKALLLPVWIVFCLIVNLIGAAWDKIDTTDSFYNNVLVVAQKR